MEYGLEIAKIPPHLSFRIIISNPSFGSDRAQVLREKAIARRDLCRTKILGKHKSTQPKIDRTKTCAKNILEKDIIQNLFPSRAFRVLIETF